MKIGVLGSGMVGQTVGGKLAELGHEVKLGTRDTGKLADWCAKAGPTASAGSLAEAAAHGEIVFNCTNGAGTMAALDLAEADNLNGKVMLDLSNPLDFSTGSLTLF